jgi:SAM-dependent methyltransferase
VVYQPSGQRQADGFRTAGDPKMVISGSLARSTRPYSQLAANYDVTVGIPFFLRTRLAFENLIRRYGIEFRTAADIGCGTGLFASYLNRSWSVPVVGVDISGDMLRIAARNCRGLRVCLLRQDIRSLRLPHRVDLITCNFDTLNHLVGDGDLERTFRSVYHNLNSGGHFIFDMVMQCNPLGGAHRYMRRFRTAERVVTQHVRWQPKRKLLSILVFIRSRTTPRRIVELYRERAYSAAEIGRALQAAGFVIRGIHDAATLELASTCPPRIIVVAQRRF